MLFQGMNSAPSQTLTDCILVPTALGLAGTALIFPGPGSIDRGSQTNGKPPFLSGLGPLYIGWIVITLICVVCGGILMLSFRHVLRKEDPFSQIVWVRCFTLSAPLWP